MIRGSLAGWMSSVRRLIGGAEGATWFGCARDCERVPVFVAWWTAVAIGAVRVLGAVSRWFWARVLR